MRILFVTDLCPIYENEKGLPSVLLNFIKDFINLNAEVVLLRPNVILNVLIRGRKIYPEKEFLWNGIKCINKNFLTPFFKPSQFNFLKKEEKFDVILSHMPSGILAAHEISKLLNIPYTAAVHASDIKVLTDFKYSFLKAKMKKVYKSASLVLPRSIWLKNKIENIIPDVKGKTELIFSGVESSVFIDEEKINKKAENFYALPYKILSAGSLIKRKNFANLIKAVSETEGATLDIAGSGKEEKRLKNLTKSLFAQEKIKFLGQLSKEEIYSLMESSPVFILPSENETFGMVYLEAMAKGCIVVCSRDFGLSGVIENNKNGFLCGTKKEEILKSLQEIKNLKNPENIMKNALLTAKAMEKNKMSQNYLNLIQKILFKL